MSNDVTGWERTLRRISDIFVVGGIPTLAALFFTLHTSQVEALKDQIDALRQTQYDKTHDLITAQKEIYSRQSQVVSEMADDIRKLAANIELASRDSPCDKETEKIVGPNCDLAKYLPGATLEMLNKTELLKKLTSN